MREAKHTKRAGGWLRALGARSIAGRINLLIAFALAGQLALVIYQLSEYRAVLWSERRHELSSVTSLALSILAEENAATESGKQSLATAQANAKARIATLRYDGENYIWINDTLPRMVMHPIKPALNGQDLREYKDAAGKKMFVEMVESVKSGDGYVDYQWPKPGKNEPQPKLSHVALFKPWDWIVGTGVYVDDLDDLFYAQLKTQGTMVLAAMMLCAIVSLSIGRALAGSVAKLAGTMGRVAAGELDVAVESGAHADEIARMAEALRVFQRNAKEKFALEANSRTEREQSEAARRRATDEAIHTERELVGASFGSALARLAAKDLSYRMREDLPDAYRKLRDDFNDALDLLEEALFGVRSSADTIARAAQEITGASHDLTGRTEQQAANLEQSVAAMQQIASAVSGTAASSSKTKDAISLAKDDARDSLETVSKSVAAIAGIMESSKQISRIIGVIDEIAFQTNLLALNAGVEAARAGDAGRGFAVVASEVRALAQRSADAAKEIKALIGASATQVSRGVELVGATGEAFNRIQSHIEHVNQGIAEIASQAIDQSATIKEVGTAISELDQMTQQNAAMAEQAAAACESLAAESGRLAQMVGEFRLSRAEQSEPPAASRAA